VAIDLSKLGTRSDPVPFTVDPARALEYAAATNDPNPAYASGKFAPPVFAVVPAVDAMGATVGSIIPPESIMMVVHGEQDMHFHRPLVPGDQLYVTGEPYSVRVGSSGTRVTFKVSATDAGDGSPVVDQYFTIFVRGMTDGESGGPDKPDHTFPEEARANRVGDFSVHVDDDQTFRYSKASGDMMPIHLDEKVAKSVGLPGIIAHGLCTMAMCSQAVISLTAGGDPAALKRLAVRFSKNVFPGNDVVTTVYAAGERDGRKLYAFEAESAGERVITNGWAEIA
jgi:acyl dehydratase